MEFFQIFDDDVVKRWRSNEIADNFKNRTEKPESIRNACQILKKASEAYTLNLYSDFYLEFQESLKCYAKCAFTTGQLSFYDVSMNKNYSRSFRVIYDAENENFFCNCSTYTETYLLCHHMLRVMHINNIFDLPDKFIAKRWTKCAKDDFLNSIQLSETSHETSNRYELLKQFFRKTGTLYETP